MALSLMLLFTVSGCDRKSVDDPTATTQPSDKWIMPADPEQLSRLLTTTNMAGRNLVGTDGQSIYLPGEADKLLRSTPDGSVSTVLADTPVAWLQIIDDTLYYLAGREQGPLHKIRTDGSNAVRIGQENLTQLIAGDDEVYAIDSASRPVRIELDGTDQTVLVDKPVGGMIRQGKWLILSGKKAEDGLLFYDLDTGTYATVLRTMAINLQVTDDFLYYTDPQKSYHVYALSLKDAETVYLRAIDQAAGLQAATDRMEQGDGQDPTDTEEPTDIAAPAASQEPADAHTYPPVTQIMEKSIEKPFMVSDGYFYYIDCSLQNQLFRIALKKDGKGVEAKAELVADDAVDRFVRLGEVIYYQRLQSSWIYAVCPLATRPVRIN